MSGRNGILNMTIESMPFSVQRYTFTAMQAMTGCNTTSLLLKVGKVKVLKNLVEAERDN